jgi:ubiquinone/menaquinone biosynthesis C-methylase UbiE
MQKIKRRLIRWALNRPEDTSVKFWEKAAKENPYTAICTGWDVAKFDNESIEDNKFPIPSLLTSDRTVLDVACGIGRRAKFISPHIKQYVGVDFSKHMIERAKERYKDHANVSFYVNDGKTLSMLDDNTFDVALCELAFQHMKKDTTRSYINEVYRVLKPNGIFISDVPVFDYYKSEIFSFTNEENDKLFSKYSKIEYLNRGPAYFHMKVTK